MRYEAVRTGDIPKEDLALHDYAVRIIDQINREDMTCHVLARVIARMLQGHPVGAGTRHVDGYFIGKGWRHSWVLLPSGNVLDVYPIGGCAPILVVERTPWVILPWRAAYVPCRLSFASEPTGSPGRMANIVVKELKGCK